MGGPAIAVAPSRLRRCLAHERNVVSVLRYAALVACGTRTRRQDEIRAEELHETQPPRASLPTAARQGSLAAVQAQSFALLCKCRCAGPW